MWKMARLSLASLPLKTESFPLLRFATRCSHHGSLKEKCVEEAIYINRQVFVSQNPRENVSAGRNAPSEKFFGMQIFK